MSPVHASECEAAVRVPRWEEGGLPGVRVLTPAVHADVRGTFAKTFHAGWYAEQGIAFDLREEFFTRSKKGVVRGMHFQAPPHDHAKLVTCLAGEVLDVLVDLRRGSVKYGQSWSVPLSEANAAVLYVPSGLAHGFLARTDGALVHYKTSSVHVPAHDRGIRWDSFGFRWPVGSPVLSPRDQGFPGLAEFTSPF